MDAAGSSGADGGELPAGEGAVETISSRRGGGVGAWERGAGFEPTEAEECAADSVGTNEEEVWGRARRALWTDVSSETTGEGRRDPAGGLEAAKIDAGGRVVEPRTETAGAAAEAGAKGAFGGAGTTGRKLSRLAGKAGAAAPRFQLRCWAPAPLPAAKNQQWSERIQSTSNSPRV